MVLTDIPDDFGEGGANLAPGGAAGTPTLVEVLQEHKQALDDGITADLSDTTPTALGVAATAGVDTEASRSDHVHAWARKKTVTITHADLTDAVDGEAQSINVGTALPAGALVLACIATLTTQFTGGGAAACAVDVGWSGALETLLKDFDAFGSTAGGAKYNKGASAATLLPNGPTPAGGKQLLATFTPDGSTNGVDFTAGSITLDVYYTVEL